MEWDHKINLNVFNHKQKLKLNEQWTLQNFRENKA